MLGGISIWKLLIVLAIVVLIFGTKRIKAIASDLGGAAKGFKSAMNDADAPPRPRKLENAEPDAEFPEQKDRSGRA
jgi:sec-independent protein translocase protein TatA